MDHQALSTLEMQSNNAVSHTHYDDYFSFSIPRLEKLNQFRIQRALESGTPQFRHVFQLIPLLLHTNCPKCPTYTEGAPEGIAFFEITPYQQDYLNSLTSQCDPHLSEAAVFDAIYSMGSISSITQTSLSDLDLWLCYSSDIPPALMQKLDEKLAKITQWTKDFGVEINFYLMHPEHFKAHLYSNHVSTEHSGSAQHFLLLDEFYRSAIRLSGKRLLWLHLPEPQYQAFLQDNPAQARNWIDFGDFSSLSTTEFTAEFFGASLWQLYKAIHCPYKSVIKILLLETYADTYPQTELIAQLFKQKLLETPCENYHFDPYLAMLDKTSAYLEKRKEWERLDRLRMCFYIKANEGNAPHSWRQAVLQQLTKAWQWNTNELMRLNCRTEWKIKQAMEHQQIIVDQLLYSYRHLIQFARRFHIDPSIIPSDTDILMRHLYSVFEILPGKVNLISAGISQNLAEKALTFIRAKTGSALNLGWYLVNQAPKTYASTQRYVYHDKDLIKVIAWAYFNGVLTADTELHLACSEFSLTKLKQFISDLRAAFPVSSPEMSERDLLHPNEIRNLIVAVNLEQDPTATISKQHRPIQRSDLFNFGAEQRSLVGSVSIIYRNMWNEIRTQHFEGNGAILKALKLISNKIYRGSEPPQSVNVFCYSDNLNQPLRDFIADLVHKCISIQTGAISAKTAFSTLKVAGQTWKFIFGQNVAFQQIQEQAVNFEDNFANLAQNSAKSTLNTELFPKEIDEFASEGFLQFFFEDNSDGSFNVYILDEKNTLERYHHCQGKKEEKVKEINRMHNNQLQANSATNSFNFPQFYQLISLENEIKIVPFQSKQHRDYLACNPLP